MKQYPMYLPPSKVGQAISNNPLLYHLLSLGGALYPEEKHGITFVDVPRRNVEAAAHGLSAHEALYTREYGDTIVREAEQILQVIGHQMELTGDEWLTYVC